ncbi:MAG TPA: hypothetical protein VIT42_19935 [Microlunatus sp.]
MIADDHDQHDDQYDDHDDCAPSDDCEGCDPDLINDLACRAEGIAAQAVYNAVEQPPVQQALLDYATAREAYRTARSAAAPEVQELRHQVKQLIERIRCMITQESVVECLDRAYRCICRRLKACGDDGGCCTDEDCEFDTRCPDDYAELVARIADYQTRLAADKACFATLIAEPAALTQRVADRKAEIEVILADLNGDPATLDLKKAYVSALVAKKHLAQVWNGFASTKDYLDCLCRALTCWTKASEAISILTGHKAVKDCQENARLKRCGDLATNTVEEVLLEYERLCGTDPCPPSDDDHDGDHDDGDHDGDHDGDDDGGDGDGDDGDEDCGCGCGHSHSRGHHRHKHRHD